MEFERLIETERQNDELLRRAREEAAAIRAAAVTAAERREASLAAELSQALEESDLAIAVRRDTRLSEIAAAAAADATRYDAVGDIEIRTTASALLDALLREGGAP
jgi:hypothetical protein